jgi:hypothetical protein
MDNQIVGEEEEIEAHVTNPRINTKTPTVIEIKKALKELKKGKSNRS